MCTNEFNDISKFLAFENIITDNIDYIEGDDVGEQEIEINNFIGSDNPFGITLTKKAYIMNNISDFQNKTDKLDDNFLKEDKLFDDFLKADKLVDKFLKALRGKPKDKDEEIPTLGTLKKLLPTQEPIS